MKKQILNGTVTYNTLTNNIIKTRYILYIVTNDTLKKVSAFIIKHRDFFAMYILYKIQNIFISTYL